MNAGSLADVRTLVIVTGGSAGFGRALLATAPEGAYRVDVSRSGSSGFAEKHVAADLARPETWAIVGDAFERLLSTGPWDRVTLVHNAGTLAPVGFAGEVDDDGYTANVLLNSACGQVLGHRFLRAVRGSVGRRELVFVSSGAAGSVSPGWSSYAAAKAAGDHWVRTVGAEQAIRGGVRVLAVAPGVLATGMQSLIRDTDAHDFPRVERFRTLHAEGGLTDPEDAARRFWVLLDDDQVPTASVVDLREMS
jgi:benzil reductase ((S)-benzoin forming)